MQPTWPSAPPSATLLSCQHRYFFNKEGDFNNLTAAAYHKKTHLLVTGFASGIFHLHELPEFNLIHSLSISDQRVESVAINSSGDWIALGCSGPYFGWVVRTSRRSRAGSAARGPTAAPSRRRRA